HHTGSIHASGQIPWVKLFWVAVVSGAIHAQRGSDSRSRWTTRSSYRLISAVRLGSSWSGTGWHDRYWSFHRVNVTLISAGPVGGALVKTCPFTGWSAGTIRPTSGDLIRRLSTVDHGVTHHSAVPM